jgi:N-acetylneuraminic acid mutarotase
MTLLTDGRVLVAGGNYPQSGAAEIYDPKTEQWSPVQKMITPRDRHAAALLGDGSVLVCGGFSHADKVNPTAKAERFDPTTRRWKAIAPMTEPRAYQTATLLPSGKVLVAAGERSQNIASAEIYDPPSDKWTAIEPLSTPHAYGQTATLLARGLVLVVGGEPNAPDHRLTAALRVVELFDPGHQSWSKMGSLAIGRHFHQATLVSSGEVLITGGYNFLRPTDSVERYDPTSAKWRAVDRMANRRAYHTATLLDDGRVLVTGGYGGD